MSREGFSSNVRPRQALGIRRVNPNFNSSSCWSQLCLQRELQQILMQAIAHNDVVDLLGYRISQSVWDRGRANTKFGGNVLSLPALKIKLNDLHMHGLQGLQVNMIGSGHSAVLISIVLCNFLIFFFFPFRENSLRKARPVCVEAKTSTLRFFSVKSLHL